MKMKINKYKKVKNYYLLKIFNKLKKSKKKKKKKK